MNDYHPKPKKENGKAGKFDFLIDYIDTLDIGKTILPVSEKEKVEGVFYRKDPKVEKRVVLGAKAAGVDEVFSRDGMQQFLGEVFREVDIFKNDIPLFLQRFVSPLSSMGPISIICSIRWRSTDNNVWTWGLFLLFPKALALRGICS